jgi:hypothetical protein
MDILHFYSPIFLVTFRSKAGKEQNKEIAAGILDNMFINASLHRECSLIEYREVLENMPAPQAPPIANTTPKTPEALSVSSLLPSGSVASSPGLADGELSTTTADSDSTVIETPNTSRRHTSHSNNFRPRKEPVKKKTDKGKKPRKATPKPKNKTTQKPAKSSRKNTRTQQSGSGSNDDPDEGDLFEDSDDNKPLLQLTGEVCSQPLILLKFVELTLNHFDFCSC